MAARKRYVCVMSDATGATAQRVVRATLAQFPNVPVEVEVVAGVVEMPRARATVRKVARRRGLLAYTMVDPALRNEIVALANEQGVVTVDLIGPLMNALAVFLSATPAHKPGLFEQADAEHFQRLEAVGFTVRHDDGLALHELGAADLVLAGPSRVSKTPISAYLAHTRGLRVANVPLALGMDPPDELMRLPPGRVVGLTMNALTLSAIRRERAKDLGAAGIEYAQLDYVKRELNYCHSLYRRQPGWPVVDVTNKSIEEIAVAICAATIDGAK